MEQIKALWNELQTWYAGLTQRERTLVTIASAAVLAFALFVTLYTTSSSAASTRRRTEHKLQQLAEAQQLAASFRESERARQAAEQRLVGANVQLISYLSDVGTRAGLDIPAMNPKGDLPLGDGKIVESAVELTLTDVTLDKLYSFLTTVENGPGIIQVKYLRIEPRPATQTLTAWVNVATYRMSQ
jgi:general secretion pathway protein M